MIHKELILMVMCGLQCSGKSTKAKELAQQNNAQIISSDEIREELAKEQNKENIFEVDNNLVFDTVYKRINQNLSDEINVIFDATNTTIKMRRQIFERVKVECEKICYIMNTPYEECLERLKERNKTSHYIPEEVLKRYYESFEIPFMAEGWDNILIDKQIEWKESEKNLKELLDRANGFNQQNKWHNQTLLKHMITTYNYLINKIGNDPKFRTMIKASYIHDVGKLFTQTMDKEGQAHYYNHENVGTYELLCRIGVYDVLNWKYYYNKDGMLEMLFYVNYHMKLHQVTTEKAIKKWKNIFGEKMYYNLKLFEEADKYRIEKGE